MGKYYTDDASYRALRAMMDKLAMSMTPEQQKLYGVSKATRYVPGQGVVDLGFYGGPGVEVYEQLLDIYGPQYQLAWDTSGLGVSPLLEVLAPKALSVLQAPRGRVTYNAGSGNLGTSGGQQYMDAADDFQRVQEEFTRAAAAELAGAAYAPSDTSWVANYAAQQLGYRDARDLVRADIQFRRTNAGRDATKPDPQQPQQPMVRPEKFNDSILLANLASKLGSGRDSQLQNVASLLNDQTQQQDPVMSIIANRFLSSLATQPGQRAKKSVVRPEMRGVWT